MRTLESCLAVLLIGTSAIGSIAQSTNPSKALSGSSTSRKPFKSVFENDARLNTLMSVQPKSYKHHTLWDTLTETATVPIEQEQAALEFNEGPVFVGGNRVSARALMDAIAARVLARWERTDKGYRLLVSHQELDFAHKAHDEFQRDRFATGAAFIEAMAKLPAEQQDFLRSQQPVPVNSLPERMRQSLSQMLDAINREEKGEGTRGTHFCRGFGPGNLPIGAQAHHRI